MRQSNERLTTIARVSLITRNYVAKGSLKEFLLSEMIVPSSTRSWLGILKYTVLINSSCQVFLLSERLVSYKYGVLIRPTYMFTVFQLTVSNFNY